MNPIDHLNDPMMKTFVKLASQYNVPDFVREAAGEDLAAPKAAGAHTYALPSRKALPIHNKAAAWLSAMYFDADKKPYGEFEIKQARSRIQQALDLFEIEWPKHSITEEVIPAEAYLVEKQGRGILPVRNENELKLAKAYLSEHRGGFDQATLKEASGKLLDRADALGFTLADRDRYVLELDAGRFTLATDEVVKAAKSRSGVAKMYGMTDTADKFHKLANDISDFGILLSEELADETLAAFAQFDESKAGRVAGLGQPNRYPRSFVSKWANDRKVVFSATGDVYSSQDIAKLPQSVLSEVAKAANLQTADQLGLFLDPDRVAEAAASLDSVSAAKAARLLKKAGVKPVHEGETAVLTADDWKALAGE